MTFYEKMRIVCRAIPAGRVATYGQIAILCGKPKNSRQVGYGLKHDLAGPDVPAFRIVNGNWNRMHRNAQDLDPGRSNFIYESDRTMRGRFRLSAP